MMSFKSGRSILVALVPVCALVVSLPSSSRAADDVTASPSPTATISPTSTPLPTPVATSGVTDIVETYPVKASPSPAATPVETIKVVASPTPSPTPVSTAGPVPTTQPKAAPVVGKDVNPKVLAACKEVYPSPYQDKFRTACTDGATQAMKTGWASTAAQCRANRGLGERQKLVCQAGATLGDEVKTQKITYTERASACRDLFPVNSPIDVYFQESCISGSDLQAHSRTKATIGNCRWLIPNDRGFLAPCAAGISLTANLINGEKTTASDLNKLCSQYFDKAQFNLGYRSCLNGLALSLSPDDKKIDVVHRCGELSYDSSGSERGSCIVGFELYRYLHKREELAKRFKICGDTKVTYGERDTLACLTASSLTDFMDHGKARKACKEIFTGRKNHSRADCERIL